MYDYLRWALVFFSGLLLGAVFFGGLWWTVRTSIAAKRPALLFFGSLLLRTGVVLTGFYLIGGDDSLRFMTCLLGFVSARIIVSRYTRPPLQPDKAGSLGGYHAP